MAYRILTATGSTKSTLWTLGRAKAHVASAGGRGDASNGPSLARAKDAIEVAIGRWNLEHGWNLRTKAADAISTVASTSTYDLPSDLNHIYSVRLDGSQDSPLTPISRREFDRLWVDQAMTGTPYHYMYFRLGQDNLIELWPVPSGVFTLTVRYYALITVPSSDDEFLDVPDRYVGSLLKMARAEYLSVLGGKEKMYARIKAEAEHELRLAKREDRHRPDQVGRLRSRAERGVATRAYSTRLGD